MLLRLGFGKEVYKDTFTKYTLAELLHARPQLIQRWIDLGWLKALRRGTKTLFRLVIKAQDFISFCKKHREAVLQGRVTEARLNFILTFVFPANHAPLLAVRPKKERNACSNQRRKDQNDPDQREVSGPADEDDETPNESGE